MVRAALATARTPAAPPRSYHASPRARSCGPLCLAAWTPSHADIEVPTDVEALCADVDDARGLGLPQQKPDEKWLELGLDDLLNS